MKCKLLRIKKNEEKSNENYICSKSGDFAQQGPNSTPTQLQPNLNGPADILYDSEFNRIVIPSVTAHEIVFYDL